MDSIFGRNGQHVLVLIARIGDICADDMDQVANVWKQGSTPDRAEAWARLNHTVTEQERYGILAATSLARREALTAAHRLRRTDWAFWAAACDAAAAVAAGDRLGRYYDTLTAPLAAVMPWLAPSPDRTHEGGPDLTGGERLGPTVRRQGAYP